MEYKFPNNFKFGVATSSYQTEGGWNEGGKTESMWDHFYHTDPSMSVDNQNGDIACDSYHKIDEDIKMLKDLKVDFYRFSISWPRILPDGYSTSINQEGVKYYNELIDKLIENKIEPIATLYHWELPVNFMKMGGWTNRVMVDYFADYANACFHLFGDRVKTWITFNEPNCITNMSYGHDIHAPFANLSGVGSYLATHTLLLAHAKTYHLYQSTYAKTQNGKLGIAYDPPWLEPSSPLDIESSKMAIESFLGIYIHPILSKEGDYPKMLRDQIDKKSKEQGFPRSRLPYFTTDEIEQIKGTSDFVGINYYTSFLVKNKSKGPFPALKNENDNNFFKKLGTSPSNNDDTGSYFFYDENWESSGRSICRVVPWGLRKVLNWVKEKYDNPEVFILENGFGSVDSTLNDNDRVKFHNMHLEQVLKAIIDDKCNVAKYAVWSLMDLFEWKNGYTLNFGLYSVDFKDPNRPRKPKKSAFVYQNIIVTRKLDEKLNPSKYLHE